MAHVLVLDSVNEDIFVCGKCKAVFNSLELFLDHKRNKCLLGDPERNNPLELIPPEIPTDCVITLTNNPSHGRLEAPCEDPSHVSLETPCEDMMINTCNFCKKTFKTRKGFLAHTKTHNAKSYQCLVCGRGFSQSSHLQRHKLCHRVWPEGLSETTPKCAEVELLSYSCPYCTTVFSTYGKFRSHLKNHQSFKKYKCVQGDCKNFYETYEMLLHHVAGSHITQTYRCYICAEQFDSLQSIARHELNHTVGKQIQTQQFKCSLCDAVFTKADKLSLHMLTENHQKVCIHCNKTFASDKRLRLHLQIHRDLKPYQCNICQTSFHMRKYLNSHMLKHGDKQHKCPVCSVMFNRIDILKRHMRKHNSSKWLPCPYKDMLNCMKQFSRRDKLKLHLNSHKNKILKIKNKQKIADISSNNIEENVYNLENSIQVNNGN